MDRSARDFSSRRALRCRTILRQLPSDPFQESHRCLPLPGFAPVVILRMRGSRRSQLETYLIPHPVSGSKGAENNTIQLLGCAWPQVTCNSECYRSVGSAFQKIFCQAAGGPLADRPSLRIFKTIRSDVQPGRFGTRLVNDHRTAKKLRDSWHLAQFRGDQPCGTTLG